jgi:hypothetical protein
MMMASSVNPTAIPTVPELAFRRCRAVVPLEKTALTLTMGWILDVPFNEAIEPVNELLTGARLGSSLRLPGC